MAFCGPRPYFGAVLDGLSPAAFIVVWMAAIGAGLIVATRAGAAIFLLIVHVRYVGYLRRKALPVPFSGVALWGYLWRELSAIACMARWTVLYAGRDGLVLGKSKNRGRPVIFVHGYTQNQANFARMRRAVEALGRPTTSAALGWPFRSIDHYARRLARVLEQTLALHPGDGRLDVVAHSMGGLVLRRMLELEPAFAEVVDVIITLGSPHHGTASARGPIVIGRDGNAMRRRSPFIQRLGDFAQLAPKARVLCVAARQDYIVYPTETSFLDGCERLILDAPGHAGLVCAPSAIACVTARLTPRSGGAPARD